ncbi:DUF6452 family protein [Soonwooa sp.]|uniref:DUF6452 family protein n=1 Tax=Soonwooa sp. TaxID=1938592 RepID=UPI0026220EF7|nr:DUF6452 family protein [Soonwooa sp.]
MKLNFKILAIACTLSLLSCGGDDDICVSGEATPRVKIKFKTDSNDKLLTVDTLYVSVDYGNGKIKNLTTASKVDSIFVPLRVDNSTATKLYFKTRKKGDTSIVNISYQTASTYVSPACGYKLSYKDVKYDLLKPNPVKRVQPNQNEIVDENKTHFFLLF